MVGGGGIGVSRDRSGRSGREVVAKGFWAHSRYPRMLHQFVFCGACSC